MSDGLDVLKGVSAAARTVVLPRLPRPIDVRGSSPTRSSIEYGITLYCYGVFSHFREMLRSFVYLADGGLVPAAFLVARALYETSAHTYYLQKHVRQYLNEDNLLGAHKLLEEANVGSRYLQEQKVEIKKDYAYPHDFDSPVDVAKAVRCFDEYVRKAGGKAGDSREEYSFLSEFCHPNGIAFMHYYEVTGAGVQFKEPSRELDIVTLPTVSSTAAILHCTDSALSLTEEVPLRAGLKMCVEEFLRLAKPSR